MKPLSCRLGGAVLAALVAGAPTSDAATAEDEAARLRGELEAARTAFEARIATLEARLARLEAAPARGVVSERLDVVEERLQLVEDTTANPPPPPASAMNPQMSLILAGSWANLSQDPEDYALQGFFPGGEESGPGERGFSLGESEMTLSAAIDPLFFGQATFAVTPENEIEVEEAYVRSTLPAGLTTRFGRFFSGVGYINRQHAHAWDFADVPLVYSAMFGGQYRNDGAELRWLAPLGQFLEFGLELGNGDSFPGADDGNGVGAWTLFASTGGDVGASHSWQAGVSWLSADASAREYEEADRVLDETANPTAFAGDSDTLGLQGVWKWAPDGNSRERSFKLQAEYFAREESGLLTQLNAGRGEGVMDYEGEPRGWYVQGVYQFMPAWRIGFRHDRLDSGKPRLLSQDGVLRPADFPLLAPWEPERSSLMLDWSPTEFSRLRLQYARDESADSAGEDQVFLQYLMSLGSHGAHAF